MSNNIQELTIRLFDHNYKYIGELKDGKPHGRGTIYYNNKQIAYRGSWNKGKWEGQGVLYYKDGRVVYKGGWKDGEKHGQGIEYLQGEFKEGNFID
jgi:antitoxin component YwqK of YwqJK toxin-antitoxin module